MPFDRSCAVHLSKFAKRPVVALPGLLSLDILHIYR